LTVTSEPTGSSGTPLPDLPSVDESLLSAQEGDIAAGRAVGGTSGALASSTPRERTPPKNELDASDRSEIRATSSGEALERQIRFEEHRARLEEHRERLESKRTKRYYFLFGGIVALSTVSGIGLKYAGLPPGDIARFVSLTFVSGISGYSLRTLTTKAWSAISSRDRSNQGGSSR
jgi:hypothetical protein